MRNSFRTLLAAVIALVIVGLGLGIAVAATITSKYPAPTNPDARGTACNTVNFDWDRAPHSDFSVVRYSTNSDFSDSDFIRPQDIGSPNEALDNESVQITDADEDDRTYWKVAVADYEGHRLSPYSAVNVALTPAC